MVGGAANLVGNVTNQIFARRNARINYEYAEKSAENQYKRQVDFWNMQNAYNDPAAARARMENAGMNPTTDMGSGINSAGSGSTVPGNEYAQSGMMPVVPTNWSGFAREVANIYNTAMSGNRAVKEAAKLEMEAKLLSLKGSGQELDNDLKKFKNQIEYMFAEDNALYDHWIKQNEHEKSLYDIQNSGKTGKLIDARTANTQAGTQRMTTLTPVEKRKSSIVLVLFRNSLIGMIVMSVLLLTISLPLLRVFVLLLVRLVLNLMFLCVMFLVRN